MTQTTTATAPPAPSDRRNTGQQHSIALYLKVWAVVRAVDDVYLVDYFHFTGMLRWTLIVLFMVLKAGLIVAVFMHMAGSGWRWPAPSCCRRWHCCCWSA